LQQRGRSSDISHQGNKEFSVSGILWQYVDNLYGSNLGFSKFGGRDRSGGQGFW
jgi:hypothetical protein